ncbi:MAG: pentapeptide repeat-containing protein, partial [Desulfuromusa sp.]|nr:pentapeptide repeat-containing protein [Desulfuromusa sp.]
QGAHLVQANLQGANLNYADLQGAHLMGAKLQGANLEAAQLQGAILEAAQLQGAILEAAQLQGANFEAAHLQGANLNYADLQGANLGGARVGGTDFSQADLRLTNWQGVRCHLSEPDDWKKLREYVSKEVPGQHHEVVLKRLEVAANREKTLFSHDKIYKEGVSYYDADNTCLKNGPPTSYDYMTYKSRLTEYLLDQACDNPYIAGRMALRAIKHHAHDIQLAKAFLEKMKACPKMKQVPEETLNNLMETAKIIE